MFICAVNIKGNVNLLFRLCCSSISHTTFFNFLEWAAPDEASFSICRRLILERLIYFPLYKVHNYFCLKLLLKLKFYRHGLYI